MSYATRLGMRTRAERDAQQDARATELKAQIRASTETVEFLGQQIQCIPLTGIFRGEWDFTGSGLVALYPNGRPVLIERR